MAQTARLVAIYAPLREAEATRIQDLEKAREVLLIASRILQERALKASEDSQKITHATTSLTLGISCKEVTASSAEAENVEAEKARASPIYLARRQGAAVSKGGGRACRGKVFISLLSMLSRRGRGASGRFKCAIATS
ncbi:hypothetical protein VE00_08284 [Pseudogymnoascus sp. WSF 3629]|nr:hypothetical protein VE00_08284 [Pseudogymnoascus sp. WSF 3629]